MRTVLCKFFSGVMLIAFLCLCSNQSAAAAPITKTLEKDTRIMPPGMIVAAEADIPKFKKGTIVRLNMYGEVLEGILSDDINLPYESGALEKLINPTSNYVPTLPMIVPINKEVVLDKRTLRFKGGAKVIFNDRGEVISGTLVGPPQTIMLNPANYISAGRGEISFHKNGVPAVCILSSNTHLRPIGWSQILNDNITDTMYCPGFVEFKAGKLVRLTETGEVIQGTLSKDTKLLVLVRHLTLENQLDTKLIEAETEVEFDARGIANKVAK